MIYKQITIYSMILLASQIGFASEKDDAKDKWQKLDTAMVEYHFQKKMERTSDLVFPEFSSYSMLSGTTVYCLDNEGSEISTEKCEELKEFVRGPGNIRSVENDLKADGCLNAIHHNELSSCKMHYSEKSKSSSLEQQKKLDSIYSLAVKTIPKFTEMYKIRIASNFKALDAVLIHLANPEEKRKLAAAKKNSKECKIYRLKAETCRKAYIESAANAGLKMEEEATKQSGAVNLYSRYKLGQMKAMHGTANLSELKKQYKLLVGDEWTPKACEPSRKQASEEANEENEAITVCGCTGSDCADLD